MKEKTKLNRKQKVIRIAVTAVMIALAFALSYVPLWKMPFGGTVTLFSMLPIMFVSIKYGIGWGLGAAFCYSWLQVLQGEVFGWGLTPVMLVGALILDYVVAFTVIGLAGIFRKHGPSGAIFGCILVCLLRFLSHFISGVVLWANYEQFVAFGKTWLNHPWLYSLVYNGWYMLPETAITVVGIILIFTLPQLKKLTAPEF
ncbi:MAG: energy-coupled thiamine transporter ThiT [Clostridia bacterium]|jgi:thiamine transporter|nr:energy-coupled thiamine transporter ThiT [Clostridia bacterium]